MQHAGRMVVSSVLGLCLAGCGGQSGWSGERTQAEPPQPRILHTRTVSLELPPPHAVVIILDGSPDGAAASLREQLAKDLVSRQLPPPGIGCVRTDEAYSVFWGRFQAIVVYAGLSGIESVATAADEPRLFWSGGFVSSADLADWRGAVAETVVNAAPVAAGSPHVLQALSDVMAVATAERAPANAHESALLNSLDPDSVVSIVLATAHEDTSEGQPTLALVEEFPDQGISAAGFSSITVPALDGDPCRDSGKTTSRLQAWINSSVLNKPAVTWRPGESCPVLARAQSCGPYGCIEEPLAVLDNGTAPCRMLVATDLEQCPKDIGWVRADRLAHVFADQANLDRYSVICEIPQLAGAALESCRYDLSCSDCGPGFCLTKEPTLASECIALGRETLPRLVSPADQGPGVYQLQCE